MVTQFLERVRETLRTPGVTAGALAKRAQLHRNTLYGWDRADWNPSAETLRRLEPLVIEVETTGCLVDEADALAPSQGGDVPGCDDPAKAAA